MLELIHVEISLPALVEIWMHQKMFVMANLEGKMCMGFGIAPEIQPLAFR
jgi:hypothetical protein